VPYFLPCSVQAFVGTLAFLRLYPKQHGASGKLQTKHHIILCYHILFWKEKKIGPAASYYELYSLLALGLTLKTHSLDLVHGLPPHVGTKLVAEPESLTPRKPVRSLICFQIGFESMFRACSFVSDCTRNYSS
jgi:hypothetical protein